MTDTSPRMLDRWQLVLEGCSPEEKIKMACSMFDFARDIVTASIKEQNPDISDEELSRVLIRRFYQQEITFF